MVLPASEPQFSGGPGGPEGALCPPQTPCPDLLLATLLFLAGLPLAARNGSL